MWFLCLALARAAAPVGGEVELRLAVDDRAARRLQAPRVQVGAGEALPLVDDGTSAGDIAGDRIYFMGRSVPRTDPLRLALYDGDALVGEVQAVLPLSGPADLSLKTEAGPPGVRVDTAAPPIGVAGEGDRPDRLALRVEVDDRALHRLRSPALRTSQTGAEGTPLRDDGALPGDTPGDGVFVAGLDVARVQSLALEVVEGGAAVGRVQVFLPNTGEAEVKLQTVDTAEGLALLSEAVATGAVQSAAATGSGGEGGGIAGLGHLLWVAIAGFALVFAQMRTLLQHRWDQEVAPRLARLDRVLDRLDPPGPAA